MKDCMCRITAIAAAAFSLVTLSGCPPVTLQTQTLSPNLLQTFVERHPSPCISACVGTGCDEPNHDLLDPSPPGNTCVMVGYDNRQDKSPKCEQFYVYAGASYYGRVGFDLTRFNGKGLASAVLKFQQTTQPIRGCPYSPLSAPADQSALAIIEFWDGSGGYGSATRAQNHPHTIITLSPNPTKPQFTIDISTALRQRLIANKSGNSPTTLYFVGDPGLPASSVPGKVLFSCYSNFTLDILFNPNQ